MFTPRPFPRLSVLFAGFLCLAFSPLLAGPVQLPASIPGDWQVFGRAQVTPTANSVTIANGFVADLTPRGDCEMSFRARMPADAAQVEIWGAIRIKDRNDRYVFGLRGGSEPEITLARYAPDNNSKFLGFAPLLDAPPKPGDWYTVRVAVIGKHFYVFLNDETVPRINIEDKDAMWTDGGIGLGGGWLPAEFTDFKITPLTGDQESTYQALGDQIWQAPAPDKETVRASARAAYQPVTVTQLPDVRGDVSLDGNWLFMPDQNLSSGEQPVQADAADDKWNVIPVPSFWTPTFGWLHGEEGMPGLKGLAAAHGPSDTLVAEEYARVNAQTFDWKMTKAGWYRQHLQLPANLGGKEFHLVFDAIAKVSQVYVNGTEVGSAAGMFRQDDYDVTQALKPGANTIAVHVVGEPEAGSGDANVGQTTAVTVTVTQSMMHSIPHGMTDADRSSGIWQPVRLVVTNPVRVDDVFVQPKLDGASVQVTIANGNAQDQSVQVAYTIHDKADNSVLTSGTAGSVSVPAGNTAQTQIQTPQVHPKLWSPEAPNLYLLDLTVTQGGRVVDQKETQFGFRTFTVSGAQFLLNGHPYWLRGGNPFPSTLRPNDGVLARKFMELARKGNVMVTRSHALPFTETWLDAADETGIGVSHEGTWPWLMIKGEPPSADLLKIWKDEFASLIHEYRNHPSLLIWTVNNEMNFASFDQNDESLLMKKWTVLSDMIQTMRQVDPTRPIVAYSGYTRAGAKKSFADVVTPNHFDDGDIDDSHDYYGWYNPTFFHLFNGEYGKKAVPNRPLISQEMSTGYPRNDDGPSRSYEFSRYTAETLVGDFAREENDPLIFMTRQAFMTKELAEVIRRKDRQDTAGVLLFSYLTWFTDVWDATKIQPKLTYYAVQKAMQPVLVSAELYGRHFYAGDDATRHVYLVNDADDKQDLAAGTLAWEIRDGATVLAQGSQATPVVPYYSNQSLDVDFKLPAQLPRPRVNAKLALTLTVGGQVVSMNEYDLVVASHDWADAGTKAAGKIQVFDPAGNAKAVLAGYDTDAVNGMDQLSPAEPLVVGDVDALVQGSGGDALKTFVQGGGRVLLLQPGAALQTLFPDLIKSYRKTVGEIVAMEVPESPVFDGIEPLDTAWFEMGQGNIPYACSGTYEVDRTQPGVGTLAGECDFHSGMKAGQFFQVAGAPLVEIHLGKGEILASTMMLSARDHDPIAGRLLSDMLTYLAKPQ